MTGRSPTAGPARRGRGDGAGRAEGDGGAVLVEAVMILPILLAMLCGLIDFGVGLRDRQYMQAALRNGARVAAATATYGGAAGTNADQLAMSTLWAGLSRLQNISIQRAVIFRANPGTWSSQSSAALTYPPATCLSTAVSNTGAGSTTSFCNIYSATQIQSASTTWTAAGSPCSTTTGWDRYWCPVSRQTDLTSNSNMGPDYLGMYVKIRYSTFTGFIARTVDMEDTAIVRLEPRS
jgi:Flp pilus assembly protein TadG